MVVVVVVVVPALAVVVVPLLQKFHPSLSIPRVGLRVRARVLARGLRIRACLEAHLTYLVSLHTLRKNPYYKPIAYVTKWTY